ncbi:MAG: lactate racemase domain-containing protein [Candidatus Hodarchaeota archaeon]
MEYNTTPIYYENEKVDYFIPKGANYTYIKAPKVKDLKNVAERFKQAIRSPLDSPSLEELVKQQYQPERIIVIVVDDHSRPNIHTRMFLPLLRNQLVAYGVNEEDLRVFIATGTHLPPKPEHIQERILGSLYDEWKERIWINDCDSQKLHQDLGFSPHKTPIKLDKRVLSACLRISLSDSEYHYFAGIAGSVKQFIPGCAARQTVQVNHSRIFDKDTGFKPDCRMGNIKDNVCIQDIREIIKMIKTKYPIFVIDTIMHMGKMVDIFAGDPIAIHDNALKQLQPIREVSIIEKADLVIVGKPSVNFYQAGKGYDSARHAVKPGGTILLLAGCQDGIGSEAFLDSTKQAKNRPYLEAMRWAIDEKCTETTFEIGVQNTVELFKLLQLTEGKLYLYSELDPNFMSETFHLKPLERKNNVQETLQLFVAEFLTQKPEGFIYVFEDFNILTLVSS